MTPLQQVSDGTLTLDLIAARRRGTSFTEAFDEN